MNEAPELIWAVTEPNDRPHHPRRDQRRNRMTRDELQLLSDINRLYRHLQLSTYEVQREVKDLKEIICSARRCIDEKEDK